MSTVDIDLEFTSPYKRTQVFLKDDRLFFGLWDPLDVQIDGDEVEVEIQDGVDGFLDLLAHQYYKDRRLWRVIAQANRIDLPLRDVVPGMRLIIPKITHVSQALQRKLPGATEAKSQNGLSEF